MGSQRYIAAGQIVTVDTICFHTYNRPYQSKLVPTLHYNVSQLLKAPVGTLQVHLVDERFSIDDKVGEGIRGAVRLMCTDKGIWVSAELELQLSMTCSRCLTNYRQPVSFAIDEEFLPVVDIISGEPLPRAERTGETFTIDQRHDLDLGEAARQCIIMNRPMKPLCNEECLGICPTCGKDRNRSLCQCAVGPADERWSHLAELFSKKNGGLSA